MMSLSIALSTAASPMLPDGVTLSLRAAPRPNILMLLIDDMGYSDLASYGSPNHSTPHIDALGAAGMRFTQWISAASFCSPSRASLQTGRYAIRTGCMGDDTAHRVIPTPASPGGLDPSEHVSLAAALRTAGYRTGAAGKWHLGINKEGQDRRYTPVANGYEDYVGDPWTNAPFCEPDASGHSTKVPKGATYCLLFANDTVAQMPLALENFTRTITAHATDFIGRQEAGAPWLFYMAYFHVHTPLFSMRANRGRSRGGAFGDNVEELDDSVGAIVGAVRARGMENSTLTFLTSDNGPYQEEGWAMSGRTNLYAPGGALVGRLKGGKGQLRAQRGPNLQPPDPARPACWAG